MKRGFYTKDLTALSAQKRIVPTLKKKCNGFISKGLSSVERPLMILIPKGTLG